jgi:ATP-dependent Clp protease adaptor protein ClpS
MRYEKEYFEESEELLTETAEASEHQIILFNDDVNTFEHVIATLIRVCEHTEEQAHQCSLIVHYKGKCSVKTGAYDELKPQCTALLEAGLSAKIH